MKHRLFKKRVPALASAALLLLVLTRCTDLPLEPQQQEQERSAPAPLVLQADGLQCTADGATLSSGAPFRVCVNAGTWNRDLVVFIPGYHDPARAPTLPDVFGESPAVWLFSQLGYAFATTGFRGTGLIESPTWIGGDLLELVQTARTLLQNTTGRTTRYVYQTGGSQGGLGTVMAVERYPNTFSGGLAACGPIGDYRRQIDYVADFRVLFDYFFADVIPAWPAWRQDLAAGNPGYVDPSYWDTAQQTAGAAIADPSNAGRIQQLLNVSRAPTDPADPQSIRTTIGGILWYSFRGTNDAILKAGGFPFANTGRQYSGSFDDGALNAGVERFQLTADPARLATLQTSARPRRQLVTIHTTGDPIVPVWHQSLYRNRLPFLSRWLLHTPITVSRYGHCTFTDAEVVAAFAVLVLRVSGQDLLVSNTVLPQPGAQAEFVRLAKEYGARPVLVR
jgi:hypothetical protein